MVTDPLLSSPLEAAPLYADVIVPRHLAGPFTYMIPASLRAVLRVGHLVCVPFGRSVIQGAVIALSPTQPLSLARERVREIQTLVTEGQTSHIPSHLLRLAQQVAETYVAPWGQCLRLVLPPRPVADRSRIILTKEGRAALAVKGCAASAEAQLLQRLKRRPLGISFSTLQSRRSGGGGDVLGSIIDRGWAHRVPGRAAARETSSGSPPNLAGRDLFQTESGTDDDASAQHLAVQNMKTRIEEALEKGEANHLLIQAPLRDRLMLLHNAVGRAISLGRRALVIVGEAWRAELLATALGHGQEVETACLHSTMPDDKRAQIWERIRQDEIAIVVGTRSSIFLPLHAIGLIWIDREEDPALKEPQEPRYHAREVAWMRAQDEQALLVSSSSHLSLETVNRKPPAHILDMPVPCSRMASIDLVDLRHESRATTLSPTLLDAMRETLDRRTGLLLFLNKKGYAGAFVCRDCGHVPRCSSCAVAFAYSRQKGSLSCHYCGVTTAVPNLCPACGGPRLQTVGEGTERVEEEVKRRFPAAHVLRIDGETMRRPKQAAAIWGRVQERDWDIIVGTQLVLRDDRLPLLGLVGIVQADAGFSLPDFRAAERTYHHLRDAVGLALPESAGGRVIVQTLLPSHHVIQALVQRDDAIFRSEELSHRTALGYPPVVQLIVLHISGLVEPTVEQAAQDWASRLRRIALLKGTRGKENERAHGLSQVDGPSILGPIPSPVPRLRGRYRRQIMVKSYPADAAHQAVRSTVAELENIYKSRAVKFDVDVDPTEMW